MIYVIKKISFFVFIIVVSGCATKISTNVVVPAQSTEASSKRRVAVLPFDGNYGKQAAIEIENILASVEVKGDKHFTVVDRQNVQQLLNEQQFQISGLVDEKSAVKFGKILGVEGIYIGTSNFSSNDSPYIEDRFRCVSYGKKGKCLNYEKYTVNCIKRTVNLSIIPKLIDIETSRVIYSNKFGANGYDSRCSDSSKPLMSVDEILNGVTQYLISQFRRDVAPYETAVYIELMDNTEGITDREGRKKLDIAAEFAKSGRLDRSCEIWRMEEPKYPLSIAYNYHVGLCFELEENLEKALEYYNKADRLSQKPEKVINEALSRIKTRIKDREKLKKQL